MWRCVMSLFVFTTAIHNAISEVSLCSLPYSSLYIKDDKNTLVACLSHNSLTILARCRTACNCRRLEIGRSANSLCLSTSATFDCDAADNATRCTQEPKSSATKEMARNNDRGSRNDLKTWQWGLIGLAIVLGIGMLLFVFNFIKNRPQRGDNRREVIQTLDSRHPQPVDDVNSLPTVSCKSKVAARGTTGSQNTNSFQMPDFSDGSYRTHAMNLMSSTLTDTDIATEQQERVFSPISASSLSARSSLYSQGVDTSTMLNTACLLEVSHVRGNISESGRPPYPSLSSYSTPSDIESLSSQITIDDSDIETGERLSCPRKKSIEF